MVCKNSGIYGFLPISWVLLLWPPASSGYIPYIPYTSKYYHIYHIYHIYQADQNEFILSWFANFCKAPEVLYFAKSCVFYVGYSIFSNKVRRLY